MALAVSLQLQNATVGDHDAARRMIEPQVAGDLARHHSVDDITALDAAIEQAAKAAEMNDNRTFAAAAGVHETLVEQSGNITMATLSRLLHVLVNAYHAQSIHPTDRAAMRRAVRSYRRLVELIVSSDAEAAISHWQAQMTYTVTGLDPDSSLTLSVGH